MIKYCVGVDPGASGAIAILDPSGMSYEAHPFKKLTDTETWELFRSVRRQGECFGILEHVHSMPKQGIASTFKFGTSYGFLKCCFVATRMAWEEATPAKWQTSLKCKSGGDKKVTREAAQRMFPNIRVTHAIADALLIAEYARRVAIERKLIS